MIIIPWLFTVAIFEYIGALISGVNFHDFDLSKTTLFQDLIIAFFDLLGVCFIIWLFMKYIDKEKMVTLGLKINKKLKEFYIGFGIGSAIIVVGYLTLFFLGEIEFENINVNYQNILISILYYALVALFEEITMRGYVLRNFMSSFNKYVALILSSLLFAFMHYSNANTNTLTLVNIFLAGIMLGSSYTYSRNLWFPIGMHFGWNLAQSFLGFNVSGNDSYSIIINIYDTTNILNGGEAGFEGSVIATVLILITIATVFLYNIMKVSTPPPPSMKST